MDTKTQPPIKYYLSIDVELVRDLDGWLAITLIVVEYPSGNILDQFNAVCQRYHQEYDPIRVSFWHQNHRKAWEEITRKVKQYSIQSQELALCNFIRNVHQTYPTCEIVSDCLSTDASIINAICIRNRYPSFGIRNDPRAFTHPIDTRSFALGAGVNPTKLPANTKRAVERIEGLNHTPWYDAAKTCAYFFRVLDHIERARPRISHRTQGIHPRNRPTTNHAAEPRRI